MMGKSEITQKITTELAEYLKRDSASIQPDYHLRDDLGLDSMAVIELVYRIEETFNIQIPDQDLAGLTCVQDVVDYVAKRLQLSADSSPLAASGAMRPHTARSQSSGRQADARKAAASKTGASKAAVSKVSPKRSKKRT